jgi:NAD(P)-dependent dehydrogenase (short-subunit alcohol dehydrogenase family)
MSAEPIGESWGPAGRIVLVTGAGDGLGRAVALALAAAGATVIASSRRRRKLEALDDAIKATGKSVTLLPLDLAEPDKLMPIGPSIYERFGRLDAVVHCAALLGKFMPTAQLDPAMLRETITVNALATQALIATLDPLLQAAPDARAFFLTDRLAARGKAFVAAYTASKQAMEALVLAYAAETRSSKLAVRLLAPPPMATVLRKTAYPGEPEASQLPPEQAAARLLTLLAAPELPLAEIIDL